MATVVVPFRADGKRRLELPADERRSVALAMLAAVLDAAVEVGPTLLVTADPEARALAEKRGVHLVDDPGGGQAAAVAAVLRASNTVLLAPPVLVVNADLPRARACDLEELLAALPPGGLALVEAADGTTNALALASPELFAPLYGPGSAERFRKHAARRGVGAVTLDLPRLAEDVDTAAQLALVTAAVR